VIAEKHDPDRHAEPLAWGDEQDPWAAVFRRCRHRTADEPTEETNRSSVDMQGSRTFCKER